MTPTRERPRPGRWYASPVYAGEERTQRARMLHRVVWTVMGAVTATNLLIALTQPSVRARALGALLFVDLFGLVLLWLSRRGRTRLASALLVVGLIGLVTTLATAAGGIRSPGVTMYFAFVLMAGVLLDLRAAIGAAILCAVLGTTLVVLELNGLLSAATDYGPITLLLLNFMYMTLVIVLTRLATASVSTALRRAESELGERAETERRLEMALRAGGIGVWEHVRGSNRYLFDERTFEIWGIPVSEDGTVTGDQLRATIHPDDAHLMGVMGRLEEGQARTVEHRIVHPDGSVRHVIVAGSVSRNAPDQPVRVVGMVRDVTDKRVADFERERLLHDLRERVKELTLLRNVTRVLGEKSFFDPSVLADVVRMLPAGWQYPEHAEARVRYLEQTYATPGWRETPWTMVGTIETTAGDGTIEVAYTRELPAADEGPFLTEERALIDSVAEMLSAFLESEHVERRRRALESQLRQSQKMEALGTLAGGIAHDFNNILTAIGGNLDLALADTKDDDVRGSLDEVKQAYERARELVRQILVFSRQEETPKEVIPLQPIVEEALRLTRKTIGPSVKVETVFADDLPPVFADAGRVHQIMMNLVTNAAYAMADKGGELRVELGRMTTRNALDEGLPAELRPGEYVRLSVSDTGVGMSPEILDRLFEPFFTTKGVAGTGLGLSVVHGIVHEHGGAIDVSSAPGEGTRFDVYFPAAAGDVQAVVGPDAPIPPGAGQRILCVDDEESIVFMLTRTLDRLGYRAIGFSDPVDALHAVRENPRGFDAVITDMGMPSMTGLELARSLHQIRPDLPVTISSGYAQQDPGSNGIAAWIQKPPSREQLAKVLADMLSGSI